MDKSDKLFLLIRSLNKNEKIYFKKFTKKENNSYLRLFDAIGAQEDYNEEELKRIFSKEKFVRQLHVMKNYLFNALLKSLQDYHSGSSVDAEIKSILRCVEIMHRKGLYNACVPLLARAKKRAVEYDDETELLLMEVIRWEKGLVYKVQKNIDRAEQLLEKLSREEDRALIRYNNGREFYGLMNKVLLAHIIEGVVISKKSRATMEDITRHPLMQTEKSALSFRAKYRYNMIHEMIASLKNDFSSALKFSKRRIELIEAHPEIQEKDPLTYINSLNSLSGFYYAKKNFEKVFPILDKIKAVSGKSTDVRAMKFMYATLPELCAHNATGDFKKSFDLTESISRSLHDFKGKIEHPRLVHFYFELSYAAWGFGDYKASIRWINKLLNEESAEGREDIVFSGRILNLLLHYEMGNYELFDSAISSSLRAFLKKKQQYAPEILFIRSLRKLVRLREAKNSLKIMGEMKKNLSVIPDKGYDTTDIILPWLISKTENCSFAEALTGR